MMPLLWLLATILVVRAVNTTKNLGGSGIVTEPRLLAKQLNICIWIAAFGQVFFSLSPAMV